MNKNKNKNVVYNWVCVGGRVQNGAAQPSGEGKGFPES